MSLREFGFAPRSEQQVYELVEGTKRRLSETLRHPFVPKPIEERLQPILQRIQVLDDVSFEAIVKSRASIPNAGKGEAIIRREILAANSYYLPARTSLEQDTIIVRKRYVANDPLADSYLLDLTAQIVGYAWLIEREMPFAELTQQAEMMLFPYKSREEALQKLQQFNTEFFDNQAAVSPQTIQVIVRGFNTMYKDTTTGILFPREPKNRMLEEARASIVQTVLEALTYGREKAPKKQPHEQFVHGVSWLVAQGGELPSLYMREAGGFHFLSAYLGAQPKAKDIGGKIRGLLMTLYNKDIDDFLRTLKPDQVKAFVDAVILVSGDISLGYSIADFLDIPT